jgi:uncharacterized protein
MISTIRNPTVDELDYKIQGLSEQTVAEYLRRHPEFFMRNESLLTKVRIPHHTGSAVSLIERQLSVMRDENQQLQRQLEHLISAAKRNETLLQQIQRTVNAVLNTENLDNFFEILYSQIALNFRTDAVTVRLFSGIDRISHRPEFEDYDAHTFALFERVLASNRPMCGQLSNAQAVYLFPNDQIGSAVLIPLGTPEPQGILALGSTNVSRFFNGMSTDLLAFLGDQVSRILTLWQKR